MDLPPEENVRGFFEFMNERESIRIKKEAGEPWPWTDDEILQTYKFTNVKRSDDKTTRHFKTIYDAHESAADWEFVYNAGVLRYFGTIAYADKVGWQERWDPQHLKDCVVDLRERGIKAFTGAYVITNNAVSAPKEDVVVDTFLAPLLESSSSIAKVARVTQSWEKACDEIRKVRGFGGRGFMAKEVIQDVILTPLLSGATDLDTYTPSGPGARRGLNRVFGRDVKHRLSEAQALEEMRYLFSVRDDYLAAHMPPLNLHDIQFQLCERDKYLRVERGEGRPRAKYHYDPNAGRPQRLERMM